MDFGGVQQEKLQKIDFCLPPQPLWNAHVLKEGSDVTFRCYVGCPRWSVKEWVGTLYPKGAKDAQFLDYFIRQFNCIELNSTFYNLYSPEAIEKWKDKAAGTHFKFCPKVFKGISHEGALKDKVDLMHTFLQSMAAFGEHLGPVFLQLPENVSPAAKEDLFTFFEDLRTDIELFVELRHPAWFEPATLEVTAAALHAANIGLVITDTAGRRDACHLHLTSPKTIIRFVTNNGHPTDYVRMAQWAEQIGGWKAQGLQELYFIMHVPDETKTPALAMYLIDALNERAEAGLKTPLVQQDLFGE